MADERDEPKTPAEIAWQQDREAAIRSFEVVLYNGDRRLVHAHYWTSETPGGALNFYTVEPSGRQAIRKSFNAGLWAELTEITPPEVSREIDRIVERQRRQGRALPTEAPPKNPTRQVH